MSDFNSLVQYTVENISRPVKYIIYKLTEFIRVVDKFVFRQVPSGAASGYATIEQIEGNTVVWNQLLKQGKLVDMGLPSGLLWATCNIDITQEDGFAASPFQYGCTMFSWGNIEGHNTPAGGTTFDYNWGSVNTQEPWYEGQVYGSTPGSTLTANIVAGDTYDSARYNLGSLFKMPTSAQFQELVDNCDFVQADGTTVITSTDKRVTVNGILGIYLKSKVNGNLIFFSASGNGLGTSWYSYGSNGYFWSASFYSARNAQALSFSSGGVLPQGYNGRCNGFAVRAVVNPNTIDTGHNNHKYYVTENVNHDLTAIFGAGNEPTTVADFEAWMAQNIGSQSYFAYNAGELLSVKMQSVRSIGFNQWDEQWELGTLAQGQPSFASTRIRTKNYIPVIGGATYFFKFPWAKFVCSYDDNYNYLGNITITNNIAALDGQVKYLKWSSYTAGAITSYNNDICINLSDPVKNGTYKPYQSDSADIDVTTITGINTATNVREVIFPNGMKQADYAGTVKDELDLVNGTATVNVGSRAYQSGDESDTSVITDGTTTYYALTTPIEHTDLQDGNGNPINPRYKVEQGGTEQVLPVNTSTPTTVAPTLTTTYTKDVH